MDQNFDVLSMLMTPFTVICCVVTINLLFVEIGVFFFSKTSPKCSTAVCFTKRPGKSCKVVPKQAFKAIDELMNKN